MFVCFLIKKSDPTASYNSNPPSRAGGPRPMGGRGMMGGDRGNFRPMGGRGGGGYGGDRGGNDYRGRDRSYDRHAPPSGGGGGYRDRSRERQPYDSSRDRGGYGGDRGGYSDNRDRGYNNAGGRNDGGYSRDYDAPRGGGGGGDYRNDDRGRFNNNAGGDRRYK